MIIDCELGTDCQSMVWSTIHETGESHIALHRDVTIGRSETNNFKQLTGFNTNIIKQWWSLQTALLFNNHPHTENVQCTSPMLNLEGSPVSFWDISMKMPSQATISRGTERACTDTGLAQHLQQGLPAIVNYIVRVKYITCRCLGQYIPNYTVASN